MDGQRRLQHRFRQCFDQIVLRLVNDVTAAMGHGAEIRDGSGAREDMIGSEAALLRRRAQAARSGGTLNADGAADAAEGGRGRLWRVHEGA